MPPEPIALSVVICTYNRAETLADTLASLNRCVQRPEDSVEVIVVDNNSVDRTADVCREFAQVARMAFRRVVELSQGLSFARNRGLREARGVAVAFTDDDTIVDSAWLSTYVQEFKDDTTDCVFGRIVPEWNGRRPEWLSNSLIGLYGHLDYGPSRLIVADMDHEFFGANFCVRRRALTDLGGFDVRLGRTKDELFIGEETRVYRELVRQGKRIVYNPAIHVRHVIQEHMKEKAYLLRYFRDTAESLVYAAQPSRRKVFGIPYFRLREFATFYGLAVPRFLNLAVRRDAPGLFALRLHLLRFNRMLLLYTRALVRGDVKSRAQPGA
jgi:glycosyltransferase involved in cell wall biosynthesis